MARMRNEPLQPCQPASVSAGIGDEVRSAIDIDPMVAAAEESVADLGEAAVEREMVRELDGSLGFVAVCAAGAFEFEAAIVGDVDLLVRMIDQERIGGRKRSGPSSTDAPT